MRSPKPDTAVMLKPVNGSFYIELMQMLNCRIKQKGDWIWLKDGMNKEILMASEAEPLTKRYRKRGIKYY